MSLAWAGQTIASSTSGGLSGATAVKPSDLQEITIAAPGASKDKMAGMTKKKFGFHRGGGKHEPGFAAANVQIYVKSSALSRAPDLAISAHLMTEAEIDGFVDDALAELEEIRIDAKKALAAADSN